MGFVCVAGCSFGLPDSPPAPLTDAAGDAGDAAGAVCPAGYVMLAGAPSLYRVVDAGTTWEGAQADCADDGTITHLAVPENEAEYLALADVVSGATRWLGVSDRKIEGVWIPIIVNAMGYFDHWAGSEPNAQDCLSVNRNTDYEAMPCKDPDPQWFKGFFCECDGHAVDPAAF